MMELENIVANTVYIKARQGGIGKNKGRSKKWRQMLKLPNINDCLHIKNEISLTKEYIIDNQPIGKKLFYQFCSQIKTYGNYCEFLDDMDKCDLYPEKQPQILAEIKQKFFNERSPDYLKCLNEVIQVSAPPDDEASLAAHLADYRRAVENHLYVEAFSEFIDMSVYFRRYLQIKQLEKVPVTKKNFRMYRVLGKGGFGEVCACQSRATGRMFACKKLEKKRLKKRRVEKLALNEKQILQKVNSRFVVNLAYAFETKDALCLMLTLMDGGDLKFHIHLLGAFNEDRALFYAAEITCGLEHLHSKRIVYRDLKPDNILLDDTGHIRISDLGLAVELDQNGLARGRVGTIGYMAPEVIEGDNYGCSPDWWSLGCIIYEMINGHSPFRKHKEKVKKDEVDRRVIEDSESYPEKFSPQVKDLCIKLLEKNPKKRLGCMAKKVDDVKNHEAFTFNWKRIEAGIEKPPYTPDSRAVYAKDLLEIEQFSSIKDVIITDEDQTFYNQFSTGTESISFQNELIETGCFNEMNKYDDHEMAALELIDKDCLSDDSGKNIKCINVKFPRIFLGSTSSNSKSSKRKN